MEKVLQMKVFASYPIVFEDRRIFNKNTLVMGLSHAECRHQRLRGLDQAKANGFGTIAIIVKRKPVEHHGDVRIMLIWKGAGPKTKGYIGSIVTFMIFALKVALRQEKITQDEFDDSMFKNASKCGCNSRYC